MCEASSSRPTAQLLLSAGHDAQIKLWRPATYGETREIDADLAAGYATLAARFSADGQRVVTASGDRTASLWDAASLASGAVRFQEGHDFLASSAVFFADGTRLVTGAGDGTVRVWDAANGAEFCVWTTRVAPAPWTYPRRLAIATGSGGSGDVQIWNAANGKKLATLVGHQAEVTAVRIRSRRHNCSPRATTTAIADCGGSTPPAANGSPRRTLNEGHSRTITALAFVDGGARLVSSSGDDTCGQWDVATGRELTDRCLKHPAWVADMVATPDGRLALTCCEDGKLRLWSLPDAQSLKTFATHDNQSIFTSIDMSPDGRWAVAACAAEGTVRLWNLQTGEEIT